MSTRALKQVAEGNGPTHVYFTNPNELPTFKNQGTTPTCSDFPLFLKYQKITTLSSYSHNSHSGWGCTPPTLPWAHIPTFIVTPPLRTISHPSYDLAAKAGIGIWALLEKALKSDLGLNSGLSLSMCVFTTWVQLKLSFSSAKKDIILSPT